MRLVGWCAVLMLVSASCAGGDDSSAPSDTTDRAEATSSSEATAVATTGSSTAETLTPSTTEADEPVDLASVINVMTLGRVMLFPPDDTCVAERVDGLTLPGRRAVEAMSEDPIDGVRVDPAGSELAFAAYLGCSTPNELVRSLVFSVLKLLDDDPVQCVVDAWEGLLTADTIAASLVYGDGLDDLPSDVVEDMGTTAAGCLDNRSWWIEDVIFHKEVNVDVPESDLECAASRYIDVFGISEVIRRRMLGVPLLALSSADEATLDLPGACGIVERGVLDLLVLDEGGCIKDYVSSSAASVAVECAEPHDAEAFAVHDLSADHPTWPGIRTVVETAKRNCRASVEAGLTGNGDYDAGVIYPRRRTWEQGDRLVTCLVVHPDGGTWTGPSGLVTAAPTSPPTTATPTTAPPTTAPSDTPSATTLPPGAREMFTLEEIDRVGMCIYRTPALPGQDDLERRFFEIDCSEPHQTELIGRFNLEGPPGASYPGDSDITARSDEQCEAAFGDYVGVSYQSSRLYYSYFYPSAATWAEGDRELFCFLVGAEADELFVQSMTGSRE